MQKYRQVSRQVFATLADITPVVEKASIDEAYLDISGLGKIIGSPEDVGRQIRRRIHQATELTASVGIGPNRLIAKLASVSNLRGVGRRTQKIFERLNIRTVAELRATALTTLKEHLGERAAASVHRQALGRASDEVVPDRQRKSISKEQTFGTDIRDHQRLHDVLRELAGGVARTTRRENLAGTVVTLKIRFQGFETYTRQTTLPAPTHDERLLLTTVWSLFINSDLPDKPVRLIGVGISGWAERDTAQADLFESTCPYSASTSAKTFGTPFSSNVRFSSGNSARPPSPGNCLVASITILLVWRSTSWLGSVP
jgi:DNA polymerase-4